MTTGLGELQLISEVNEIRQALIVTGDLIPVKLKNYIKNPQIYNDKLLLPIIFAPIQYIKLKVTNKAK
jgi:hypothetical protein